MLTNFITDLDLITQYTKIMSYLPTEQKSYANKIGIAFELVLNDLRIREIDANKIHLPIDLNRDGLSTSIYNQLIPLTKTTSGNNSFYAIGITGFRRFVIELSVLTGTSVTFTLQGSNDIVTIGRSPANWNTVVSLSFIASGTKSIVASKMFKYYRLVWTFTGTTFTFTAGLYETK